MDIKDLTLRQVEELKAMFGSGCNEGLADMVGQKVIIRTYSAGVWFGEIEKKAGDEVIVKNARRLWQWKTKQSISLSAVAVYGVDDSECRFAPAVERIWLQAIELIPCTKDAIKSIEGVSDAQAR